MASPVRLKTSEVIKTKQTHIVAASVSNFSKSRDSLLGNLANDAIHQHRGHRCRCSSRDWSIRAPGGVILRH